MGPDGGLIAQTKTEGNQAQAGIGVFRAREIIHTQVNVGFFNPKGADGFTSLLPIIHSGHNYGIGDFFRISIIAEYILEELIVGSHNHGVVCIKIELNVIIVRVWKLAHGLDVDHLGGGFHSGDIVVSPALVDLSIEYFFDFSLVGLGIRGVFESDGGGPVPVPGSGDHRRLKSGGFL